MAITGDWLTRHVIQVRHSKKEMEVMSLIDDILRVRRIPVSKMMRELKMPRSAYYSWMGGSGITFANLMHILDYLEIDLTVVVRK